MPPKTKATNSKISRAKNEAPKRSKRVRKPTKKITESVIDDSSQFSSDVETILSSTVLNASKSLVLSDENTTEVLENGEPQKKKKKTATVTKVPIPRKRKLRPEDQRTLEILAEKFRSDQSGAQICQVPNCKSKPLVSDKPSNLKRHLAALHPVLYEDLFPHEVSNKRKAKLDAFNTIQDAIELVTVNGQPFSLLECSGMKGFIKPRLAALRAEGQNALINRHKIVDDVAKESDLIREYISNEVKGKTVSIMFDVCTIATLSMLGVEAVFMKECEAKCRSLGPIIIQERHTAVQLANMLYDVLKRYGISLTNVFSITSDTAKNAIATSRVLNLVASEKDDGTLDDTILDMNPEDDDEYFGIDEQNEAELQKVIENMAAHDQLVKEMTENITSTNKSLVLINQVNCCTHVTQLAINGAIDESNSLEIIKEVHQMCVLIRTQVVMIELRKLNKQIILPPLDNDTRWNSKYLLVSVQNIDDSKSCSISTIIFIIHLFHSAVIFSKSKRPSLNCLIARSSVTSSKLMLTFGMK